MLELTDGDAVQLIRNENLTIDNLCNITVDLSKIGTYGPRLNYEYKVVAYDANNNVIVTSNTVTHSSTQTSLDTPKNIAAVDNTIGFNKVFGADSYTVVHKNSSGTVLETKSAAGNSITMDQSIAAGDTIEVTANNAANSWTSQAGIYTVPDNTALSITDLSWDTNGSAIIQKDDKISFKTPEGYQSLGSENTYYYELRIKGNSSYETAYRLNIDAACPATIDTSTGIVTAPHFAYTMNLADCDYYVALVSALGTKKDLAKSNYIIHSYPVASLQNPRNLAVNIVSGSSNFLSFNTVYGANKYIVTHTDSSNAAKADSPLTYDVDRDNFKVYAYITSDISAGDIFTVTAQRIVNGEVVYETQSSLTYSTNTNTATITGVKITGVNLSPTAGEVPVYSGKVELTGTNISSGVVSSTELYEMWYDVSARHMINRSNEGADDQMSYNEYYNAVFAPNKRYSYGFGLFVWKNANVSFTFSDDVTFTIVDSNGHTYSNLTPSSTVNDSDKVYYQFGNISLASTSAIANTVTDDASKTIQVSNTGTDTKTVADAISSAPAPFSLSEAANTAVEEKQADNFDVLKNITSDIKVSSVVLNSENKISKVSLDMNLILNYINLKNATETSVSMHDAGYNPGTISMKVPVSADFNAAAGDSVDVAHTLTDGTVKHYVGTVVVESDQKYVTYDNPDGFSEFDLTAGPYVAATGVTLNQSALTLVKGNTSTLTATVAPTEATNKDVTWSSSDENIATVGTDGKVTAVAVGSATITATSKDNTDLKATCSLTVDGIHVTGVTITPAALTIAVGETGTLTANIEPSEADNKAVTWTSSDSKIATVANGIVTGVAPGTATITATTSDGKFTATRDVEVIRHVTGITLPESKTINIGDTTTLSLGVQPADASDQSVTWRTSDSAVASIDTTTGLITGAAKGTVTITARSNDNSNAVATCSLTVEKPLTNITIASEISLYTNESQILVPVLDPTDSSHPEIEWSTDDSKIATVSSNGIVTAVAPGTTTINVRSTTYSGVSASCTVTVSDKAVESISISDSSLSLFTNGTHTLTAAVSPKDATHPELTWTSSDDSVASYSNGIVTANAPGTAIITVKSTA